MPINDSIINSKLQQLLELIHRQMASSQMPSMRGLAQHLYSPSCSDHPMAHCLALATKIPTASNLSLLARYRELYDTVMQRYAAEISQPLAQLWQRYDDLHAQAKSIQDPEDAVKALQRSLTGTQTLWQDVTSLLPFCLESGNEWHPRHYLPLAIRNDQSIRRCVSLLYEDLTQKVLGIPSGSFNLLLPRRCRVTAAERGTCPLCSEEELPLFPICSGTCGQNRFCYSCLRKLAWSQQHDEHRIFQVPRPVLCPYCRSEHSLSALSVRLAPVAERRSPRITAKRQRVA